MIDFNNILMVILSHTELLIEELQSFDPMRDDLEEVRKAAQRGAGLTRQLLLFSRHEVAEAKVIDVRQVIRDLSRMLERVVGESIELVTILPEELPAISGNTSHLEQLIVNLVVNARDAMENGGTLTIQVSQVGAEVVLEVADTGIGMDEATLGHIFEPFFTTKERGKGTGLGLATAFGIVENMRGRIDVSSTLGRGTTFRIAIPVQTSATTSLDSRRIGKLDSRRMPRTRARTAGETILLVEDEAPVRAVVATMLRKRRYNVLEVATPQEAIHVAARHDGRIDLLLTDVVMPTIGGAELARWLRQARPEMKLLFMSGHIDDEIANVEIRRCGAFLQKPFRSEELGAKVRTLLDAA